MNTLPKRKSIRLKGYDYGSEGAYFVTICTHDKKYTLSRIRRDDPCGRPRIVRNSEKLRMKLYLQLRTNTK